MPHRTLAPTLWPALAAALLCATPHVALAQAQTQTQAGTCSNEKLFGDERRFECEVALAPGATPPRFVALFSGSHDDTRASVKLQLSGQDHACAAGSKTETEGEDGNVALSCRLPAPPGQAAGTHRFTLLLRWHHAEYEGFRLEP